MALSKKEIEKSSTRPPVRLVDFNQVPESLQSLDRWIMWKYAWSGQRECWTKVPIYAADGPGGRTYPAASSTDPSTWTDWYTAHVTVSMLEDFRTVGLGFVVTEGDGITVVDLDDCRNRETGEITEAAWEIINALDSYTEVSPSLTGVKVFVRATKPGPRCKSTAHHVEMYDGKRFVAMTGRGVHGCPGEVNERQEEIDNLYARLFPQAAQDDRNGSAPPDPSSLPALSLSDAEIIERASTARNGHRFDALWRGDASAYANDRSSADFALASMLAFWVGPDAARVESLMRQSGMARPKWDRRDYMDGTIGRAIAGCREFFGGGQRGSTHGYVPSLSPEELEEIRPFENLEIRRRSSPGRLTAPVTTTGNDGASITLTFADPSSIPPPPSPLTEAECACLTATSRADFNRFPCSRRRLLVMRHRRTALTSVLEVRCQRWCGCVGCRRFLQEREISNLRLRFLQASTASRTLYEIHLPASDPDARARRWAALSRRIRRHRGEYVYVRSFDTDGSDLVITTAPLGAVVSQGDAISLVSVLLDRYDGDRRPLSTSRGWRLPRERSERDYALVSLADPTLADDFERMQEIANAAGCHAVYTPARDPERTSAQGRTSFHPFDPAAWLSDLANSDHLEAMLAAGDVLPRAAFVSDGGGGDEDEYERGGDPAYAAASVPSFVRFDDL